MRVSAIQAISVLSVVIASVLLSIQFGWQTGTAIGLLVYALMPTVEED